MRQLWRQYVQPIIDYCSQMWCPLEGGQMMRLESLLESYTKRIKGFQNLNYWERLTKLSMTSIQRRFEQYKIIYCHKNII